MDYSHRDLADRLAAEYVLGTLRGPARRRFENLLPAHPALREAVAQWQQRLSPLSVTVLEVTPSARVWRNIETRLFGERAPPPTLWQRLSLWRGLAGGATAATVAMFMVSSRVPPPQAPIVVVLGANPEAAQALRPR